jgi:olefin beta-lactone synthetase
VNVVAHLAEVSTRRSARTALVVTDLRTGGRGSRDDGLTFAALESRALGAAQHLAARGVGRGDRVLVLCRPSTSVFACICALLRLGAVVVVPPAGMGPRRLGACVDHMGVRAVIGSRAALWLTAVALGPGRRVLRLRIDDRGLSATVDPGRPIPPAADLPPDAPALLTWSGGSTRGEGPRPITRSHGVLEAQHEGLARALPVDPDDVDLTAFPIVALHDLAGGVPVVVVDGRPWQPDPDLYRRVHALMERCGVTTTSAAPSHWQALCDAAGTLDDAPPLPLRRVAVGGAPIEARLVRRLRAIAPRAEIVSVYGSTEVEPVAVFSAAPPASEAALLAPWMVAAATGAGAPLGHVVEGVVVAVRAGASGPGVPAGAGEIFVKGSNVARADARSGDGGDVARRGGWHGMGDHGHVDPDGCLWLLGRAHSIVTRGKVTLYPVPLEMAVGALPFVRRAAVVALPILAVDDGRDFAVALAVQPEPAASTAVTDGTVTAEAGSVARGTEVLPADWESQVRAAWAVVRPDWPPDAVHLVRRIPVDRRHGARTDYRRLARLLLAPARPAVVRTYLAERFPPLRYGVLILTFFGARFLLSRVSAPVGGMPPDVWWRFLLGALVIWLAFFHLRVIDEHRDHDSDARVHPRRVLSRGLITLGDLRTAGIVAVAAEVLLSAALGPAPLVVCLAFLGLSWLIARDFLLRHVLERHVVVNALVHLAILPAFALFAFAAATGRWPWQAPPAVWLYSGSGYAAGLAFEVARKVRAPEDERPGLVTYSAPLGTRRAAATVQAALVVAVALALVVAAQHGAAGWYAVGVTGLMVGVAIAVAAFWRRPTPNRAARLAGVTGLVVLAIDALLIAALAQRWVSWPP